MTFGLRRFLQEQPAFRPAVSPDRFMPLADRIRDLGVGVAFPKPTLLPSPSGRCDSTSCPVRWDQPRACLSLLYGLRWGFLIPIFMLLLVPVAKFILFIFSASYIVVLTFDFSNFSCQAK
jgi:hypothetical protein